MRRLTNIPVRAGGVKGDAPADQAGEGGSIPTPALYYFHLGQDIAAARLVRQHHYSKRPTTSIVVGTIHEAGGLIRTCGRVVGACVFSPPVGRWAESGSMLELSRLVRRPGHAFPLSRLVSLTVRAVDPASYDLLVSYADVEQGHHGGIYQACGWTYAGRRKAREVGLRLNGEYWPMRSVFTQFKTAAPKQIEALGINVEVVYDGGKHLYWKALRPEGRARAARLALGSLPYPKPRAEP